MNPEEVIIAYQQFVKDRLGIAAPHHMSPRAPNATTFFCTAGMQPLTDKFLNEGHVGVEANIQRCVRMEDLATVGDATHSIMFDMLGLFAFRQSGVEEVVSFFMAFVQDRLGIKVTQATVHPRAIDWLEYYNASNTPVRCDRECEWTLGKVSGYCTEFYARMPDGVELEIGNIVNPLGTCIDVGFGAQRLALCLGWQLPDRQKQLMQFATLAIAVGVEPSNKDAGYVLRRVMRELLRSKVALTDCDPVVRRMFDAEVKKLDKCKALYERIKDRNTDKTASWWWFTHGIKLDEVTNA